MILTHGNLFAAPADTLVNPVNTVGVMGKGLALGFRERYPDNYRAYRETCKAGRLKPGGLFIMTDRDANGLKTIINFATKAHWRNRSRLQWIENGLKELREYLLANSNAVVALPALGCGLGGLGWREVHSLLQQHLGDLPNTIYVFPPKGSADGTGSVENTTLRLKPGSAMLLAALFQYAGTGLPATPFVAHKLVYFLKALGGPYGPSIKFLNSPHGPVSTMVDVVLQRLEGTYFTGYIPKPFATLSLNESRKALIDQYVATTLSANQRSVLTDLAQLLEGQESVFQLELLATVHLIRFHYKQDIFSQTVEFARGWLGRTSEEISAEDVAAAIAHLDKFRGRLFY